MVVHDLSESLPIDTNRFRLLAVNLKPSAKLVDTRWFKKMFHWIVHYFLPSGCHLGASNHGTHWLLVVALSEIFRDFYKTPIFCKCATS